MMLIRETWTRLKESTTLRHKEGDAAIAETAHILRESFRGSDLIARTGGDEFALLLTGGEAEFDREKLDRRLKENVEKHNRRSESAVQDLRECGVAHSRCGPDSYVRKSGSTGATR